MSKAYNLYIQLKYPYQSDAEKIIISIYSKMKASGNLDLFTEILKKIIYIQINILKTK